MDIRTIEASFEDRLKALRGSRSVNSVSKEIGINPQTLGRYEKGERVPDIINAKLIADYYGVSIDWLIGVDTTGTNEREKAANLSLNTGLDSSVIWDLCQRKHINNNDEYSKILNMFLLNDNFRTVIENTIAYLHISKTINKHNSVIKSELDEFIAEHKSFLDSHDVSIVSNQKIENILKEQIFALFKEALEDVTSKGSE